MSVNAEASRRLPPLRPRLPRAPLEDALFSSDDETPVRRRSRSTPQHVQSTPPPLDIEGGDGEVGPSANGALPHREAEHVVDSSDDEPLSRRPSRNSPRRSSPRMLASPPQRDSTERGDEGVEEGYPRYSEHAPFDEPVPAPDSHPADSSFDSMLSTLNGSHPSGGSNRSTSPAASTSTESSGPRRFTAQEKGKGRALSRPSVIEMSDDEAFDESIQFIHSKPAPPIDISDDEEAMMEEPPEAAIDEESSVAAFSEST